MILVRCFLMLTVLWASVAAADRPNILLFLVDDMGVGDTSVPFFYRDGQPVKVDRNDPKGSPEPLGRLPACKNVQKLPKMGPLWPKGAQGAQGTDLP